MQSQSSTVFQRTGLPAPEFIFGSSAGMREIRKKVECALHDDLPVLIEGESGTGKEVIGRFLHFCSARSEGPFVKFSCAAIPAGLVEEEMFGARASSDVRLSNPGAIALADRGTLFIDELADLPHQLQPRLAEAVNSARLGRGSGSANSAPNTRLVCATSHAGEKAEIGGELFRAVEGHRIRLLPLRERKADIPQLCEYLLGRFAQEFGKPLPRLSPCVLSVFEQWRWPGNIRELENWIARIVIFGTEEVIGREFSRQLLARQETGARNHRARRLILNRPRRLRRRG